MTIGKALSLAGALAIGTNSAVSGYDACATTAINTLAHVTTSYDTAYDVRTAFRSATEAAASFSSRGGSLHVVEGPFTWVQSSEEKATLGTDFNRDFALGHHFHAFLLRFDEMVDTVEDTMLAFAGIERPARRGVLSTGGIVHWVEGDTKSRPAGLQFQFGEAVIHVTAEDWREQDGLSVPYRLIIDDGSNQFFYAFETVDLGDRPPTWFHSAFPAPELNEVQLLRLHRDILTAHCQHDANRIAELTAPVAHIVSGGSVTEADPASVHRVFTNTFARRAYTSYVETSMPKITVSNAGDIGWAVVEVEASGALRDESKLFREHWAWALTAKKVDGRWLMAGNAANMRPE